MSRSTSSVQITRANLLALLALPVCLIVLVGILNHAPRIFAAEGVADVDARIGEADKAIATAKTATGKINEAKGKFAPVNKLAKFDAESSKACDELATYLTGNIEKAIADQDTAAKSLTGKMDALAALRNSIDKQVPAPAGAAEAIEKLRKKEAEAKTQLDSGTEALKALNAEADKTYGIFDAMAKDLTPKVAPLADEKVGAAAKAEVVLPLLAAHLGSFSTAITGNAGLSPCWTALKSGLEAIKKSPDGLAAAVAGVKSGIDTSLAKILTWLETIAAGAKGTNKGLEDQRDALDKDLQKNAVAATKAVNDAEREGALLSDLATGWEVFAPAIKTNPGQARMVAAFKLIKIELEFRPKTIALVRGALNGDFANFKSDFVQLYFFTDTYNLMKAMNPNVQQFKDVSALRAEAARQRGLLDDASLAQVSAQAAVNELQTRVRDLEDALRDAESNVLSSAKQVLIGRHKLDELKSRTDADPARVRLAEQRQSDVEAENTANQATLTKLNDAKAGLPTQIAAAKEALIGAQRAVRDRRIAMIGLARVESDAFAQARDSEPVFFTSIEPTDNDPLKHIQMYAFGSRRVIFLRGTEEDLEKAKEIIALFDRPAPQARLNLWTLELNSTPGNDGAKKFNRALDLVEAKLAETRAQIAAALSYLRDCVNQEVNSIAIQKLRELEFTRLPSNGSAPTDARQFFAPKNAEDMRWARMYFYQKEVLLRLGFDSEKTIEQARHDFPSTSVNPLPDPAGTTTLGETLIVLSLANQASRYEILNKFSNGVYSITQKFTAAPSAVRKDTRQMFLSTIAALGAADSPYYKYQPLTDAQLDRGGRPKVDDSGASRPTDPHASGTPEPKATAPEFFPPRYAYTSMQKEIVDAILKAQAPKLLRRLRELRRDLIVETDEAAQRSNEKEQNAIYDLLYFSIGIPAKVAKTQSPNELRESARKNLLRTANAKIARTDLMLRQLINAVDEDVDHTFVQPMVRWLRDKLVSESGIGVGILNRTSVLASNRLAARVDARSSAQLTVGEEQDVLAGVQQLANLYLAAQTGGLFGGLAGLNGIPQKQTSEVYGINNGSLFKVTPIFDPTGQALRFQFDYVLANNVTDPDGSITPQLPRIERHTVNTEVELNNLELREISRFSSNSRLGIPTTRKGGIPIIKDIPGMKYVPLLGWFVRRSGKSAVIQQSLMFGQTTMYPTIADIFDLVSSDDLTSADGDDEQLDLYVEEIETLKHQAEECRRAGKLGQLVELTKQINELVERLIRLREARPPQLSPQPQQTPQTPALNGPKEGVPCPPATNANPGLIPCPEPQNIPQRRNETNKPVRKKD